MGTGTGGDLHVLCYQHHGEMPLKVSSESTDLPVYVCGEPDCPIRFDRSRGYFLDTTDKIILAEEILPRVMCASDGRPMYLAEVQAERRSFRLWKCPECGASRTDEETSNGLGKKMGA